ncbi:MAG TPA: 30S ribosomal protein S8, partial [Bacteroidales bacterium]|nr:30S ribosomal protein S8 [Bacteroidales bacterium]
MNTDPIADYLTRVRNAITARHKVVEIPTSSIKREITKILFEKGYILNYKFEIYPFSKSIFVISL